MNRRARLCRCLLRRARVRRGRRLRRRGVRRQPAGRGARHRGPDRRAAARPDPGVRLLGDRVPLGRRRRRATGCGSSRPAARSRSPGTRRSEPPGCSGREGCSPVRPRRRSAAPARSGSASTRTWSSCRRPPRDLSGPLPDDVVALLLADLDLTPDDRTGEAWVAGAGLNFVHLPVRAEAVGRAWAGRTPVSDVVAGLELEDPLEGVNLYALDGPAVRARVFVPGLSVPEDPATGSAAAGLGMALVARGRAPRGRKLRDHARASRWDARRGCSAGSTRSAACRRAATWPGGCSRWRAARSPCPPGERQPPARPVHARPDRGGRGGGLDVRAGDGLAGGAGAGHLLLAQRTGDAAPRAGRRGPAAGGDRAACPAPSWAGSWRPGSASPSTSAPG